MGAKFSHHKYEWSKPWTSPRHNWQLVGPEGGVHFHVSLTPGYDPSCGLEFHHTRAAWMRLRGEAIAPHHLKCHVLNEPCWHDGTSLYASEHLWPLVEQMLRAGERQSSGCWNASTSSTSSAATMTTLPKKHGPRDARQSEP